jgi:hypothetical protein
MPMQPMSELPHGNGVNCPVLGQSGGDGQDRGVTWRKRRNSSLSIASIATEKLYAMVESMRSFLASIEAAEYLPSFPKLKKLLIQVAKNHA